jgi:hypothetical protein
MEYVFLIIACGLAFQAYRNNKNSKKKDIKKTDDKNLII